MARDPLKVTNIRLERDGGYQFDRPAPLRAVAYCLDAACSWRTHVDAVREARLHSRATDHLVCIERTRHTVLVSKGATERVRREGNGP